MENRIYEGPVFSAKMPTYVNSDNKTYFIVEQLDENGSATLPVLYLDRARKDSTKIIATVLSAYIEERVVKIAVDSGNFIQSIKLGGIKRFPRKESCYVGLPEQQSAV